MPPNLGPSLVRGPRQWPNWPKPRAGPGLTQAKREKKKNPLNDSDSKQRQERGEG